jgi:CheY-like chemotaxis protein
LSEDLLKPRLLAVDDNPDHAELVARIAAKCGYDARSTSDPLRVDQIVKQWTPNVITIDLCMPRQDGLETAAVLQAAGFKGPLLIISAQDQAIRVAASHLASARGMNVAGNVAKPIDVRALRELLTRLM